MRLAASSAGAAIAAVALLGGCTSSGDAGTITLLTVAERSAPIALAGRTLEGNRLDLASYRGKTVVLNVWGSWCTPCRAEAPALRAASDELSGQGVAFVGINYRDADPAQAIAMQRNSAISYPSLVDEGGELLLALRGAVSSKAVPSTLVLDGQGRIAARITGATTKVTLVDVIEEVRKAS